MWMLRCDRGLLSFGHDFRQNCRSCEILPLPLFSCPARVSTPARVCPSLTDALSIFSKPKWWGSEILLCPLSIVSPLIILHMLIIERGAHASTYTFSDSHDSITVKTEYPFPAPQVPQESSALSHSTPSLQSSTVSMHCFHPPGKIYSTQTDLR